MHDVSGRVPVFNDTEAVDTAGQEGDEPQSPAMPRKLPSLKAPPLLEPLGLPFPSAGSPPTDARENLDSDENQNESLSLQPRDSSTSMMSGLGNGSFRRSSLETVRSRLSPPPSPSTSNLTSTYHKRWIHSHRCLQLRHSRSLLTCFRHPLLAFPTE